MANLTQFSCEIKWKYQQQSWKWEVQSRKYKVANLLLQNRLRLVKRRKWELGSTKPEVANNYFYDYVLQVVLMTNSNAVALV